MTPAAAATPVSALARLAPGGALSLAPGWRAWAEDRAGRVLALAGAPRAEAGLRGMPVFSDEAEARLATGWRPWTMLGPVAVIGVEGLIVPELGVIGWSWATGCAELRWALRLAAEDASVQAVALRINSGGGMVEGVPETAAAIRALRGVKPVAAVAHHACSAAYWIASAAETLAASPTGAVGHVGVIVEHWDDSEMLRQWGLARTVLTAGARKGDLYPALTEAGRSGLQAAIDGLRRLFAADVAAGRGIDPAAVLATEALAFHGPEGAEGLPGALAAGLIDAIAYPDAALVALAEGVAAGLARTPAGAAG